MPARKRPTKREEEQRRTIEDLQIRLAEAEETLRAIREGEVDAVIVSGTRGEQVFSLVGADSIYRLIVETMKEAAFTVTLEGTILFCNAQFGQFVQRPLELVVGHPLHEFVAEHNRAAATAVLVSAREQSVKQRLVFQAADGQALPAHVSANVLNQPDGLSICVVASDLTELENSTELIQKLRRQQEALQASNEELAATEEELRVQNEELSVSRAALDRARARYQDLFDTAPDGYVVTDPEGTIREINAAADQLLGCPAANLRGNPLSSLFPAAQIEGYLGLLAAIHAGVTPVPACDMEIRPLEGRPFWASVRAAASRDEEGHVVELRWMIRDIGERKRDEERLQRAAEELERSNKELAAFAHVASHDLQEPLRTITGFLSLVQQEHQDRLDEKARNYIGRACDGARRMSSLIRDLLDFSKIGAEAKVPVAVNLAEVADMVKSDLQTTIREHDALITVDSLPTVLADAGEMRQLLQNLIGNALKFRVEGRRSAIHIGARHEKDEWVLQVRDNGIGIPPEQRERIFLIFQRLHGREEYPGTGIGLAICKKIVDRHGGRIWVESELGKGSTFFISLPGGGTQPQPEA